MRVFDDYRYNLIAFTPFCHTKEYVDNALAAIGVSYADMGFLLHCGDVDKMFQKYPSLQAYCRIEDPSRPAQEYGNRIITSLSPDWTKGELYAKKEDLPFIEEIFRKIPRPWNFGFAKLMLDGIDWYGEGVRPPALNDSFWQQIVPPFSEAVGRSGILLEHSFGDRKKRNTVWVRVEATASPSPRDTSDIPERLKPFFGMPDYHRRLCFFTHEENERTHLLEKQFRQEALALFEQTGPKTAHTAQEVLSQPFLPGLCNKRTIQKVLRKHSLTASFVSGNLPGANQFVLRDEHGFKYQVLLDRSPSSNGITFRLRVVSYQFTLSLPDQQFWFFREEEAEPVLSELMLFLIRLREECSQKWANAFGEDPEWA